MSANRLTLGATVSRRAMRRLWTYCALVLCAILVACSAYQAVAQAPQLTASRHRLDSELAAKLLRRGDLTLRKTNLADALFTIGEMWDISLVVSEDVEGQVNGVFQDAPLREILNAILLSNGYSYYPLGKSLVVLKSDKLGDTNPLFETATIQVPGGDPKDIVAGAKLLLSPKGKVQEIPSSQALLVLDFPDRVAMVRSFVNSLKPGVQAPAIVDEHHLEMASFEPQFVPAAAIKEALSTALSPDGKIAILEQENRAVIVDYPAQLRLASRMLKQVDIPRQQVRITAYIYDISLEDMHQLGINWSHALQGRIDSEGNPQSIWSIDSITQVPFEANALGGAITFFNMSDNFDLNAVINALDQASDSRLLADPNVVVIENEPAMISIVSEIPFQQLTQTGQGGNIGTTAFREAGVKLTVTPNIAEDATILMEVEPEFSRLTGFTTDSNQPVIDRRTARTSVRVANGHTVVIGGLRQRTKLGNRSGIPYLKNIPGLGVLFRGRDSTIRESELVVFIKPEIVTVAEPNNYRQQSALNATHLYLDKIPVGDGKGCFPNQVEVVKELPEVEDVPSPRPDNDSSREDGSPELETLPDIQPVPGSPPRSDQTSIGPVNNRTMPPPRQQRRAMFAAPPIDGLQARSRPLRPYRVQRLPQTAEATAESNIRDHPAIRPQYEIARLPSYRTATRPPSASYSGGSRTAAPRSRVLLPPSTTPTNTSSPSEPSEETPRTVRRRPLPISTAQKPEVSYTWMDKIFRY